MSKETDAVIDNIIRIRKNNRISIVKLSVDSGISRSHLFYIESKKTSPTLETLDRIAKALNVDITDFFKEPQEFNLESMTNIDLKVAEDNVAPYSRD